MRTFAWACVIVALLGAAATLLVIRESNRVAREVYDQMYAEASRTNPYRAIQLAMSRPEEYTGVPAFVGFGILFAFGVLLLAIRSPRPISKDGGGLHVTPRKCPQCGELVRREAKICRFCRFEFSSLEPLPIEIASSDPPTSCPKCGSQYFHRAEDGTPVWVCDGPECFVRFAPSKNPRSEQAIRCNFCNLPVTPARPICPKCGKRVRISRPA